MLAPADRFSQPQGPRPTPVPRWVPRLSLLGADLDRLHGAATTILETTGVNVHGTTMRQRLVQAGARPGEGVRVHLPLELVQQALGTAPSEVIVCDRHGRPLMPLAPRRLYFGTGSDLVNTRDLETGQRRPSALEDVARAARLCDALDEIDFVMSFGLPHDLPGGAAEPRQYGAMVRHTSKPVIMTSFSGL
ncbi:MAG: trimethylamine methyltransferase family protein, partial [Gemmatimonadota bacterium]